VGKQVSEFVHIANKMFDKERESFKTLQIEFKNSVNEADPEERKQLRKEFNLKLKATISQLNEMKRHYHNIFDDYRHDVKQLAYEAKGLSIIEKQIIRDMDKTHSKIKSNQKKHDDSIENNFIVSITLEKLDIKVTLKKIKTEISHEKMKFDRASDHKMYTLKQQEINLEKKKAHLEFNEKKIKLGQDDIKLKELQKEIDEFDTQIKEKEIQVRSDSKSGKSSDSKSGKSSDSKSGKSSDSKSGKSSDSKSSGKSDSKSKSNGKSSSKKK
jgi:hypothetical protein